LGGARLGTPFPRQAGEGEEAERVLARFDRALDVHLSSIRHKLGSAAEDRAVIETVRGVGYQWVRE
jgi:two-component system, OmpR family, response regulator